MKLTEKQKRFCDFYIETGNATESYKRAGYKAKNDNIAAVEASKLLRNPKIQDYIQERLAAKDVERIASQDEVLEYLTDVMRGKAEETKDRIKAAELLGKRHRMFTDKVEHTGKDGGAITFRWEGDT